MKPMFITICALLLVGCAASPRSASLDTEQATALATQLANEKAFTVYHSQPFQKGQPAHFEAGHWIWTGRRGVGRSDLQATVELAADGSTNNVTLQLFDSQVIPRF
ncbi:MAG TPA: hypothetical protein VFY06_12900 [Verrucomicrobiae bacterium]|nr:hypothetical protein [Verrucomicrobiae bacterium]